MKISIIFKPDEVWNDLYLRGYLLIKNHKWKWQSVLALVALGSGIVDPIVGVLLDTVTWYTREESLKSSVSKISLALYIMTIPLLMLGFHCLDLLEKKSSASSAKELQSDELDLGLKD